MAAANACAGGNHKAVNAPMHRPANSVPTVKRDLQLRHFPFKAKKDKMGIRSKAAICAPQLSQWERPLVMLLPSGQRRHNAPAKLPQIAPNVARHATTNHSGKPESPCSTVSWIAVRADLFWSSGNRARFSGSLRARGSRHSRYCRLQARLSRYSCRPQITGYRHARSPTG